MYLLIRKDLKDITQFSIIIFNFGFHLALFS